MNYLDALKVVHEEVNPTSYVEIGCRFGDSLALASCKSIGIDPAMRIKVELNNNVTLFSENSDDFFEKKSIDDILGEKFHLSFVDGMHLAEYALRDFMNLEKQSASNSVVLFDDILPKRTEYAFREPVTNAWCGDVYKVIRILKKYRPDLSISVFDVSVKGLGIVTNLDASSTVLQDNLEQIEKDILSDVYDVEDAKLLRDEFAVKPVNEIRNYASSMFAS